MAVQLTWSPEALEDIEQIAEYIERDSQWYARAVVSRLFEVADTLIDSPLRGRIVSELRNMGSLLRHGEDMAVVKGDLSCDSMSSPGARHAIMATKLQDLSLEERLKLVEDLWDSIAAEERNVALTEAQRMLLEERLDEYELDGEIGEPVMIVVERIRRSL